MAEDGLNDYERLRQENIRRNQEKLAPLRRKAHDLFSSAKRSYQVRPKPKAPTGPVRSSARRRGIAPDNLPPDPDLSTTRLSPSLASSILGGGGGGGAKVRAGAADDLDAGSGSGSGMVLMRAHVRKVLPSSIVSMRVLPLAHRTVVAAGDSMGNIGYWDVDADGVDGVFRYWPHKRHVSAIVAHQAAPHKVYSSSHQGEIYLMDFEKEKISLVHSWESPIYSLCQAQNSVGCLYFGDEKGDLTLFDERVGKVLTTWDVHEEGINSIDFHPENPHMLATSSTDQTACIWDVRNIKSKEPDSLKVFKLNESAQSAYFSPSGRMLAVTISSSICGTVRVFCVDDFEKSHSVEYNNPTGTWPSAFKVIWGWNDTDLIVGNRSKGIDIISVDVNDSGLSARNSSYLTSEHMACIPNLFSAHPYKVGYLACSSSSGMVYLWTRA